MILIGIYLDGKLYHFMVFQSSSIFGLKQFEHKIENYLYGMNEIIRNLLFCMAIYHTFIFKLFSLPI